MEQICNDPSTTLSLTIDGLTTTVVVASAAGYPTSPNFRIRVGNELMLVTAVSGTTWTVTRAIENTTASPHSIGSPVNSYLTAGSLTQFVADSIASIPSGPVQPTIRGTRIQASVATTYTVAFPTGTQAGDLAIVMAAQAFGFTNTVPTGWTVIYVPSGVINNLDGIAIWRILNSADITAGSMSITAGGSFDGVFKHRHIRWTNRGIFSSASQGNGTGSSSITLSPSGAASTSVGLYFGAVRGDGTATVNFGTLKGQATTSANAYGALYTDTALPTGGYSLVYSYSASGSGNFQTAIYVRAIGS